MASKPRYRLLLRLWPYLRPYWPWLVVGGAMALAVSSAEGFIAWLVKPAMDDIFLKRDLFMLKVLPLILLGTYIVKGFARYGQSYFMAAVGERVIARIRRELYSHIQGMSLSFYSQVHSAELMTRVREEAGKYGPRHGALTGMAATGGVITSAGAVLAGTFAALATLPVTFLAELGFAVAFGVLLDTIIVRSVLVTALNLDLGRWVWWPSRLAREPVPEADITVEPAAVSG